MPASFAIACNPLVSRVLMALVDSFNLTQRFPWGHQTRLLCRLACWSRLVRRWEWEIAKALFAFLPVSSQRRDILGISYLSWIQSLIVFNSCRVRCNIAGCTWMQYKYNLTPSVPDTPLLAKERGRGVRFWEYEAAAHSRHSLAEPGNERDSDECYFAACSVSLVRTSFERSTKDFIPSASKPFWDISAKS